MRSNQWWRRTDRRTSRLSNRPELPRPCLVQRPLNQISGRAVIQLIHQRQRIFQMFDDLATLLCRIDHGLLDLSSSLVPLCPARPSTSISRVKMLAAKADTKRIGVRFLGKTE